MTRALPLLLLSAGLLLAACGKPANIECPTVQLPADGVLADTSADIKQFGQMFEGGYSGNILPEAIRLVRQKYPQASNAEIRNFLSAAYCPVARASAVGKDDQKAKLQQFESALETNLLAQ